jgi:hypothetical protein
MAESFFSSYGFRHGSQIARRTGNTLHPQLEIVLCRPFTISKGRWAGATHASRVAHLPGVSAGDPRDGCASRATYVEMLYWWVAKLSQHDLKLGVPKQHDIGLLRCAPPPDPKALQGTQEAAPQPTERIRIPYISILEPQVCYAPAACAITGLWLPISPSG